MQELWKGIAIFGIWASIGAVGVASGAVPVVGFLAFCGMFATLGICLFG